MAEYDPNVDVYTEVVEADISENFTFIQDVKLQEKTATQNGVVTPDAGKDGLSKVTVAVPLPSGSIEIAENGTHDVTMKETAVVAVPNSYTALDEGKVVNNGALVAQTAHATVTENGTIDTTLNNSVTVNVSGGSTDRSNYIVDPEYIDYLADPDYFGASSFSGINYQEWRGIPSFSYSGQSYHNEGRVSAAFGQDTLNTLYWHRKGSSVSSGVVWFLKKIPADAQKLYVTAKVSTYNTQWAGFTFYFASNYRANGFNGSNIDNGSSIRTVSLTSVSKTTSELDNQTGVTFEIAHTSNLECAGQTVEIDISNINQAFYLACFSYCSDVYLRDIHWE